MVLLQKAALVEIQREQVAMAAALQVKLGMTRYILAAQAGRLLLVTERVVVEVGRLLMRLLTAVQAVLLVVVLVQAVAVVVALVAQVLRLQGPFLVQVALVD